MPKILVFRWEQDSLAEGELLQTLQRLPAEVVDIGCEAFPAAVRQVNDADVAACVMFVSKKTLSDKAFASTVKACIKKLERHGEFRLFVYLSDITLQQLRMQAALKPDVADLLDSVHISDSPETERKQALTDCIVRHLGALAAILDHLKYERFKSRAVSLWRSLILLFAILVVVVFWERAFNPGRSLDGYWFPWTLAVFSVPLYLSFIAICSFGSKLQIGNLLKWVLTLYPLLILNAFPPEAMLTYWRFVLAGVGVGFLLDSTWRISAQYRRQQIPVAPPVEARSQRSSLHPMWQDLRTLVNAPVVGVGAAVFLSYSRASGWGSGAATALHKALQATGIRSFLDVEGISEGSSWRDRIQRAIGTSSVFISVQDSITVNRHWPMSELNAALCSQAQCGLPTIIILRHETLSENAVDGGDPQLVRRLLPEKSRRDPSLLRIIDFNANTPQHLASGLTHFESASVMNRSLSLLIRLLLFPTQIGLIALGNVGAALAMLGGIVWIVLSFVGINPMEWLTAHRLSVPCFMIVAFWAGYLSRLVIASRFELLAANARLVYWSHLLGVLASILLLIPLIPERNKLIILFGGLAAGIGFLLGCHFIENSLQKAGKYRKPPAG